MRVDPYLKTLSARELLEAARSASRDVERHARRLERMAASEGVRGASIQGRPGGSRDASGMARTDARIDYERAAAPRIAADLATIDYARAVLYGARGRGGIAALYHGEGDARDGTMAADLLCSHYVGWRYCTEARPDLSAGAGIMSWDEAAGDMGISRASAYRCAAEALELVDMLGFERVAAGEGAAAD